MRTLVTGGAGFIGSNLVDRLLDAGDEVDVVDNLSTGAIANLASASATASFSFHELDITSADFQHLVQARRPEVIFHLAAQSSVVVSMSDPVLDAEVNLLGTVRVLEAARRAGSANVVFAASGGTLYGEVDAAGLPAAEDLAPNPMSFYGLSKAAAIGYLRAYRDQFGLGVTALALANVYGPRQDPRAEAGVIAIFCDRARRGEPLVVHGDGEQTRDFVHVADVVDAFVRAAAYRGELVLNIGTGTETSLNALLGVLETVSPRPLEVSYGEPRPGDVRRSALDASLARRELGWQPAITLEVGLADLVRPPTAG